MFTTDSRCNIPLHLLLTDMVEMCGGNTELIKTLNRIGAVAALETHRRLVTKVVEERLQRGIKDELTTGAFALASADNLDQNAPYAGVYNAHASATKPTNHVDQVVSATIAKIHTTQMNRGFVVTLVP